jgi:hypothetical protein
VKDVKLEQKFAGYTRGPSWRSWSSEFRIVTTVANLWKFYSGYYRPPAATAGMDVQLDFQHLSDTAYAVLNKNVAENIKAALQRFIDTGEPAYFAWQYLESTYRSRDVSAQLILEGKLSQLQMKDGESIEDFLTRACTIRDELGAIGLPVSEQKFCLQLLHALPNKGCWIQFKGHFQYRVQLSETEVMAAFHIEQRNQMFLNKDKETEKVRDRREERRDDQKSFSQGQAQVCWFCKKTGHNSRQCWHKPQGWVPSAADKQ